jgi:hypothetical protein
LIIVLDYLGKWDKGYPNDEKFSSPIPGASWPDLCVDIGRRVQQNKISSRAMSQEESNYAAAIDSV